MTKAEEDKLKEMVTITRNVQNSNAEFKETVMDLIRAMDNKVTQKHIPVNLEHDILSTAQQSIQESIVKVMSGYDSPMVKLVKQVVNENDIQLKSIISDSFKSVISTEEFKQSIVSAFSHKVARSIISNNDGLFDKVSNELKQDAIFKSKMALAVANVVEECLRGKE